MPDRFDRLGSSSNSVPEQVDSPVIDKTAGTPCIICPSREMRQAFIDHDRGLVAKLADRVINYIKQLRGR